MGRGGGRVGGSKKKNTLSWKSKTNSGIMLTSKGDFSLDFVLPHAWYRNLKEMISVNWTKRKRYDAILFSGWWH